MVRRIFGRSLAAAALLVGLPAGSARAAAGDLDPSFGDGGLATSVVGDGHEIEAVAVQPDGKIVLAGQSHNRAEALRFTSTGPVDNSFGHRGVATTTQRFTTGTGLVLRPGGAIDVAGRQDVNDLWHAFVQQFTRSGDPDPSFGTESGSSSLAPIGDEDIQDAALTPDGKLMLGGDVAPDGDYDPLVVRENRDGTLDTSYGLGKGYSTPTVPGVQEGTAIAVQKDGKPVIASTTGLIGSRDVTVTRLSSPRGLLDPGFGPSTGSVTVDLGGDERVADLLLQRDGKPLIVGWQGATSFVMRFNTDGTPDASFGVRGHRTLLLYRYEATAVAQQRDGKLVIAATRHTKVVAGKTTQSDFAVLRLDPDGSLDSSFGQNGRRIVDYGPSDIAAGVAIQRNGRIVVGGSSGGQPVVLRLLAR